MTAVLLGVVWAAVVLVAGCRHRPLPHRPLAAPTASEPAERSSWRVVDALGRAILNLHPRSRSNPSPLFPGPYLAATCTRREPAAPSLAGRTTRWVGTIALLAALSVATLPVLMPAVVLAGWGWPRLRALRCERRRLARLEAGLPEVVDLLALAVGGGANVAQAVAAAGRRGVGPLAGELALVTNEVRRGRRVSDALDELPRRAGEATRPLVAALTACERYGAPLGPALERLGDEVRRQRQRRAEEAARKVPVVLLFPLVLCILPAFALLTVAPLVAGALRALRL